MIEKIALGWVPSYFMQETTASERSLGTPHLPGRAVNPIWQGTYCSTRKKSEKVRDTNLQQLWVHGRTNLREHRTGTSCSTEIWRRSDQSVTFLPQCLAHWSEGRAKAVLSCPSPTPSSAASPACPRAVGLAGISLAALSASQQDRHPTSCIRMRAGLRHELCPSPRWLMVTVPVSIDSSPSCCWTQTVL